MRKCGVQGDHRLLNVAAGAGRAHRSFRSPLAGRFVRFAAKCLPGTRSPSVPPLAVPPAPPSSWRLHIYAGMRKVNRCYKGEKRALPASWVRSGPPFFYGPLRKYPDEFTLISPAAPTLHSGRP